MRSAYSRAQGGMGPGAGAGKTPWGGVLLQFQRSHKWLPIVVMPDEAERRSGIHTHLSQC